MKDLKINSKTDLYINKTFFDVLNPNFNKDDNINRSSVKNSKIT